MTSTSHPITRTQRWKDLLVVAWPLIIANSFWNIQMTIDRIFLGQFSMDALAATVAVTGVFWAPMALVQQTAGYVTTFVAQLFGADRHREIGSSVWQSIYVSIAGGLLFLLLIPLAPGMFRLMGHAPHLQVLEVEYFQAMTYSALPAALVAAASGFFTGLGRSSIIMWINAVGMVGNIVLDYMMIFGKFGFPAWGVAGAGYATALSSMIAAVFGFYLVFKTENEKTYATRSSWKFNPDLFQRFLKFGLPAGLQWSLEGLAFTAFLLIVGRMPQGEAALAASGIAVTIMMLAIMPVFGVGQAASVLLAQHLGEDNTREAELVAWSGFQVSWLYVFTIGTTFFFFPHFYIQWFQNAENAVLWQQVAQTTAYLLIFVSGFILFDSMNLVFSMCLKGAGDTRFVSAFALVIPWPIMVLPTWLMKDWEGALYWAWGAASLYSIVQAMVFWRRFEGGKWKKMRVIEPLPQA
jgi:MATE family multidrug resistance protein